MHGYGPSHAGCAWKSEKIPLDGFWDRPLRDLLELLQATPAGLTSDEATRRLRLYGPNSWCGSRALPG